MDFLKHLAENIGLHDAGILQVNWDAIHDEVNLVIDDLWSNYVGLPEYKGPLLGTIKLLGVRCVSIDFTKTLRLDIINVDVEETSYDTLRCIITLNGNGRIIVEYKESKCPVLSFD